jgi:hypothetical protein
MLGGIVALAPNMAGNGLRIRSEDLQCGLNKRNENGQACHRA